MNKALKILAGSIVVLVAVSVGILLYWEREQSIDFTMLVSAEIEHCGKSFAPGSLEYQELVAWLRSHQHGWKNTPATYVPRSLYTSPGISVNVLKSDVVINYQSKDGRWNQVIRGKKENELVDTCTKANTTLQNKGARAICGEKLRCTYGI